MALLTGYHLLGVGIGGFLFVPSSRIWGKRHTFILGNVVVVVSCIWAAATGVNYTSLLWARVLQGVGLAPFEALVNAAVADLYCVHQRGTRMAVSNFAVFGGAFFTPVVVGKITAEMGWEWTFWFVAIFAGVLLPFVVLFVPEMAYRRPAEGERVGTGAAYEMKGNANGEASHEKDSSVSNTGIALASTSSIPNGPVRSSDEQRLKSTPPQPSHPHHKPVKKTFWQSTALFSSTRLTDDSFFKLLFRPFPLFLHPGILWACLIQGTLIGWTVLIGIILAAVMLGPPLFFTEVETGYMYTGAFIGALVGFALAGLLADRVPAWMTKRNGGVYEPEFRMVLVLPQLVLGCAGLYGFGIVSSNPTKYGWFWPDFFFGMEVAGMVLGAVASALYIADAHGEFCRTYLCCLNSCDTTGSHTDVDLSSEHCHRGIHVSASLQEHLQLWTYVQRI